MPSSEFLSVKPIWAIGLVFRSQKSVYLGCNGLLNLLLQGLPRRHHFSLPAHVKMFAISKAIEDISAVLRKIRCGCMTPCLYLGCILED